MELTLDSLSSTNINKLIRELQLVNNNLTSAIGTEIHKEAMIETEVQQARLENAKASGITDGNNDAKINIYPPTEAGFTVEMSGSQVAFLEFGTGQYGQNNPYPKLDTVSWQYNIGSKIRFPGDPEYDRFKKLVPAGYPYWIYKNGGQRFKVTSGIIPQCYMFYLSMGLRAKIQSKETYHNICNKALVLGGVNV